MTETKKPDDWFMPYDQVMEQQVCVWESDGKAANGEPFLSVWKLGHYFFSQRAGTDSVAFILTNEKHWAGLINIYHGPTPDVRDCAFTGSMDMPGKYPIDVVVAEVKEESGYVVNYWDIEYHGTFEVGTQTNEMVHLYIVNVTEDQKGEREPDGPHEAASTVVWMKPEEALQSRDWKAVMLAQYLIGR